MINRVHLGWNGFAGGRFIRPMFIILCPLLDPIAKKFNFLFRQWLSFALGWHDLIIIGGKAHPEDHFTLVWISRDEGEITIEISGGSIEGIQAKASLTVFFIRSMTGNTAVGKKRFDLSVKINLLGCMDKERKDKEE